MSSQRRLITLISALLTVALLLSACERPFQPDEEIPPANTVEATTPAVEEPTQDPSAEPTEEGESPRPEETVEPTAEGGAEVTPEPTAEGGTEATAEPTAEGGAEATAEPTAEPTAEGGTEATPEPTAEATTAVEPTATATAQGDRIHTVQAGENLFRIGLQYGVSWIVIANANNIADATRIYVGQQLVIPSGDGTSDATPTPTDDNTYTVQPGDTLFKIGQSLNIDWRLIAEANGIINPNYIVTGTVLKIPSADEPGPTPEFTHTVEVGETLFLISLDYGVTWNAIAEANDISAPYIIYPGQELVIPSSS